MIMVSLHAKEHQAAKTSAVEFINLLQKNTRDLSLLNSLIF
jgi:hypothetical protein